jgi:hypothetical protein
VASKLELPDTAISHVAPGSLLVHTVSVRLLDTCSTVTTLLLTSLKYSVWFVMGHAAGATGAVQLTAKLPAPVTLAVGMDGVPGTLHVVAGALQADTLLPPTLLFADTTTSCTCSAGSPLQVHFFKSKLPCIG